MRYGIPYNGSKNGIAKAIVDFLPSGGTLIDLFAGGCAVTHAALERCAGPKPKWRRVITNDIDPMPIKLFADSVAGKHTPKTRKQWISREDFARLKDTDPYVRYCWSFANNGHGYLYAKEIEPWKRALHGAYVLGDYALIDEITGGVPDDVKAGGKSDLKNWIVENTKDVQSKYIDWYRHSWYDEHNRANDLPVVSVDALDKTVDHLKEQLRGYLCDALRESGLRACDVDRYLGTNGMARHYFGKSQWEFPTPEVFERLKEILPLKGVYPFHLTLLKRLQSLQSLQSLESLERLERLEALIGIEGFKTSELFNRDYRDMDIPNDAVVYCDIPYQGTDCGCYGGFDHAAFFDWANKQTVPVYISSYQIDDPRFECVWEVPKRKNSAQGGGGKVVLERIYTVRRQRS